MRPLYLWLALCLFAPNLQATDYFPAAGEWQHKRPGDLKVNEDRLQQAVQFAKDNEYRGARDLRGAILEGFAQEPFHEILGPVRKRGGAAGLIVKDGYIIAEWGDVERVDMTFSVTKSYLSSVAGVAHDRGLIPDLAEKAGKLVWDGTFDGAHNSQISWEMLLNQSSDWSGDLFGVSDWADRPPKTGGLDDWKNRTLVTPGTVMEYNDVRVNVLAYALLQVLREPLPQVLKTAIMDPIGASSTWRWYGYDKAWVNVDGIKMQSVTGGGHSGGGIFISTTDQARFGLMMLRGGRWQDKQILSAEWLEKALRPSTPNPSYGLMWWLNHGPGKWPGVNDESLFYASGFGGNFIVLDRRNDLMIVTRWLEPARIGEMVGLVLESLSP